jgi:hypothetical protein
LAKSWQFLSKYQETPDNLVVCKFLFIRYTVAVTVCPLRNFCIHLETLSTAELFVHSKAVCSRRNFVSSRNSVYRETFCPPRNFVSASKLLCPLRNFYVYPLYFYASTPKFLCPPTNFMGYTVAQLVGALLYKPEGRGFVSAWCHWDFALT